MDRTGVTDRRPLCHPSNTQRNHNNKRKLYYVQNVRLHSLDPIHQLDSVWIVEFSKILKLTPNIRQTLSTRVATGVKMPTRKCAHSNSNLNANSNVHNNLGDRSGTASR